MSEANPRTESLFWAALALAAPEERARYLEQACGGDHQLRGRLEELLAAYPKAEDFLEPPAAGPAVTVEEAPAGESPGAAVGSYKLLEPVGEGGMGTVWMAQQTEPVKRLVAVKLIKAGMDSRQVLARFEAERQALALMDHANIAKVLDAGTSGAGRPYFVMELVRGVPITHYCDEHRLTPRQRLGLFVPVCQAVQHAHQKGVIHRDLKPSNVLVAPYDGRPVPKVIDFGVAKAAGQQLTDRTLVTGFGTLVGTPEYMSPEQAELNNLDIDTRSDIYSLGVILYELLTGSPPFTRQEQEPGGVLEMLRVIREQEPTKPSTKLSTAEGLPTLAANRGMEPAKLTKLVRGELDWIVMKALEKDRTRRYETANALALDVQRYLADEPVVAGPPTASYRSRKFLKRHKGPVIAGSVILGCLVVGIIGTSAGLVWAVRERDDKAQALIAQTKAREAERQAHDKALAALLAMSDEIVENQMARDALLGEGNKEFLREIIKHFEGLAAITADDAESRGIRAVGYARVGDMRRRLGELQEAGTAYADAVALYKQLAADFPARPEFREGLAASYNNLGLVLMETGRPKEAEAANAAALALARQLAADFPARLEARRVLGSSHHCRGLLLKDAGQLPEAEAACADALALRKQLAADFPARSDLRRELAGSHNNLGNVLKEMGRLEQAETAYAEALALRKQLAAQFPGRPELRRELAGCHHNLGLLHDSAGRRKKAEAAHGEALALRKQLATEFPARPELRRDVAGSHHYLALVLMETGRPKEAEAAHGEALALQKQLATDFPARPEFRQELARSHHYLGVLLHGTGRRQEAAAAYAEALALQKALAADFPDQPEFRRELAASQNNLGLLLKDTGRLPEAAAAYGEALALWKQLAAGSPNQPDLHNLVAAACVNLASLRLRHGDFRGAKAHLEEAGPHHVSALRANPRSPAYRRFYRVNLGTLIRADAGLGDPASAKQGADKMRDLGWDPPGDAYHAACALALCVPLVGQGNPANDAERDKLQQFYADQALAMLRVAVAKGFKEVAYLKKDNALAAVRQRDDFKKLLAELEAKQK
jgi:serine/threonine protein kinase/tetratricopeptide (TPR) repeat protein